MASHQDQPGETNRELDDPEKLAKNTESAGPGETAAGDGQACPQKKDDSSARARQPVPSGDDVHALLSQRIMGMAPKPRSRWRKLLALILGW
jgi:hypothetical protein